MFTHTPAGFTLQPSLLLPAFPRVTAVNNLRGPQPLTPAQSSSLPHILTCKIVSLTYNVDSPDLCNSVKAE